MFEIVWSYAYFSGVLMLSSKARNYVVKIDLGGLRYFASGGLIQVWFAINQLPSNPTSIKLYYIDSTLLAIL